MDFNQLLKLARQGTPVRSHSNLVNRGDIFVALTGSRVNGADYIQEALKRGASWVVARAAQDNIPDNDRVIIHQDPRDA
ncbi:MAG: Mur ligase domain-containing protein, partial [Desulfonatronovibrionaceae bacterium]